MELGKDIKCVLFDVEAIAARVKELGREISRDFKGEQVVMICILNGACPFFTDLIRAIDLDVRIDFITASSYGNATESSGIVQISRDLRTNIEGKNVIVVEDIIDTGITLCFLSKLLSARNPKSISICTLLNKEARREKVVNVQYSGFPIADEFVVGYGLDYNEKYRNLPYVGVLKEEKYL